MKLVILTVIAMAAALLYVPQRSRTHELSYTWVFRSTETQDVPLLILELGIILFFALLVWAFVNARRK
jgi:hypothetical protein